MPSAPSRHFDATHGHKLLGAPITVVIISSPDPKGTPSERGPERSRMGNPLHEVHVAALSLRLREGFVWPPFILL